MDQIFSTILSPIIRAFRLLRSFIIYNIRVDGFAMTNFMSTIKQHGKLYSINEEFGTTGLSKEFEGYALYKGIYMTIDIHERLLRAGASSTDYICHVKILRFQKERLLKALQESVKVVRKNVPIYILKHWGSTKIGSLLDGKPIDEPYIPQSTYTLIDRSISKVLCKKLWQTGILLYGPPGNGKSYLIKHFAIKYELPLYIASLYSGLVNHEIIEMFAILKGPAIVVFEDFDSNFNKRKSIMDESSKFSIDAILNVIDGAYSNNKGLIFIMTANNIGKIDPAFKYRPSRFKHVLRIGDPNLEVRTRIFAESPNGAIKDTSGLSLDQVLTLRERLKAGDSYQTAVKRIPMRNPRPKK